MKHVLLALVALMSCPCFAANQAVLSWGAVTKDADGNALTGVTYNVYQAAQGSTKTKVQTGVAAATFTVTSGLPNGTTQCFQVSASANGVEGALSNEACKTFPFREPAAPTDLKAF